MTFLLSDAMPCASWFSSYSSFSAVFHLFETELHGEFLRVVREVWRWGGTISWFVHFHLGIEGGR